MHRPCCMQRQELSRTSETRRAAPTIDTTRLDPKEASQWDADGFRRRAGCICLALAGELPFPVTEDLASVIPDGSSIPTVSACGSGSGQVHGRLGDAIRYRSSFDRSESGLSESSANSSLLEPMSALFDLPASSRTSTTGTDRAPEDDVAGLMAESQSTYRAPGPGTQPGGLPSLPPTATQADAAGSSSPAQPTLSATTAASSSTFPPMRHRHRSTHGTGGRSSPARRTGSAGTGTGSSSNTSATRPATLQHLGQAGQERRPPVSFATAKAPLLALRTVPESSTTGPGQGQG